MNFKSISCLLQLSYQVATLFNYFYLASVDTRMYLIPQMWLHVVSH